MINRGHDLEQAHRLFSEAHGCTMRTAQRNSRQKSDKWIEFMKKRSLALGLDVVPGIEKNPLGSKLPPAPFCIVKPADKMSPEEFLEASLWQLLRINLHNAEHALDPIERSACARHVAELAQRWQSAKTARIEAEERAGKWPPVSEYFRIQNIGVRMKTIVEGILEHAAAFNRDNPLEARAALTDWLHNQYNPAVDHLHKECQLILDKVA